VENAVRELVSYLSAKIAEQSECSYARQDDIYRMPVTTLAAKTAGNQLVLEHLLPVYIDKIAGYSAVRNSYRAGSRRRVNRDGLRYYK
jgi:hypothetical protein